MIPQKSQRGIRFWAAAPCLCGMATIVDRYPQMLIWHAPRELGHISCCYYHEHTYAQSYFVLFFVIFFHWDFGPILKAEGFWNDESPGRDSDESKARERVPAGDKIGDVKIRIQVDNGKGIITKLLRRKYRRDNAGYRQGCGEADLGDGRQTSTCKSKGLNRTVLLNLRFRVILSNHSFRFPLSLVESRKRKVLDKL